MLSIYLIIPSLFATLNVNEYSLQQYLLHLERFFFFLFLFFLIIFFFFFFFFQFNISKSSFSSPIISSSLLFKNY